MFKAETVQTIEGHGKEKCKNCKKRVDSDHEE